MNPLATAWSGQVVTNGGAAPGATTMNALSVFFDDVQLSANLLSKMITMNLIAPDNMFAAFTPQFKQSGSALWTSGGSPGLLPAILLSVNGYDGDADTGAHPMQTGVIPSTCVPALGVGNGGATTYVETVTILAASTIQTCGCVDGGGRQMNMDCFDPAFPQGAASFCMYDFGTSDSGMGRFGVMNAGFYSMNRTSTSKNDVYFGRSTVPFGLMWGNNRHGVNATTPPTVEFAFDGVNNNGAISCSGHRISLAAVHQGLTYMECLIFYNAFVKFRTAIGGGLV